MNRRTRIALRILGGLALLLVAAWLTLAWYVHTHKEQLLVSITRQLNENLDGELIIKRMEPELIRGFPNVSVALYDVHLRDRQYNSHGHELLQAKSIYASVSIWSLIKGNARIARLSVKDASVYMFTDSLGYTNASALKGPEKTDTAKQKNAAAPRITHILLDNVTVVYEQLAKKKIFHFLVRSGDARLDHNNHGWDATARVNMLVRSFTFRMDKGSFIKDKTLKFFARISYDERKKQLSLPQQEITVGDDKISASADFSFAGTKPFSLHFAAQKIPYHNAVSLLAGNIQEKLGMIDFKQPVKVEAHINGALTMRGTPSIKARFQIIKNELIAPGGNVEGITLNGSYNNEAVTGKGFTDENTVVTLTAVKGTWHEIPFAADTIMWHDLKHPRLYGRLNSTFALPALNDIGTDNTFYFNSGKAQANLLFRAVTDEADTTPSYIVGTVKLMNAAMVYTPRSLPFNNIDATLRFAGEDVFVDNASFSSGVSQLRMQGKALNFLELYFRTPEKMLIDWNIQSPIINLNEFFVFLGRRGKKTATVKKASRHTMAQRINNQLDRALDAASVNMQLNVDRLRYRRLDARRINARLTMQQSSIILHDVSVNHAGGSLRVNGQLDNTGDGNAFAINADMNSIDVQQLFADFENFGQQGITSDEIRGRLTSSVNIKGRMKDNGQIIPYSMDGAIDFHLKNGALVHFSPLEKIGKFVFRKRNLSDVRIASLKNRLDIKGAKVTIPQMDIYTSALNIFVEGVYSFSNGTDIRIDIPLRNPKKDELIDDPEIRAQRSRKGIVLHLKAVDGDDGKVKIKWAGLRGKKPDEEMKKAAEKEPENKQPEEKKKKKFGIF